MTRRSYALWGAHATDVQVGGAEDRFHQERLRRLAERRRRFVGITRVMQQMERSMAELGKALSRAFKPITPIWEPPRSSYRRPR